MDGVSTENVPVNIKPLLQSITPGQSLTSNADGQEIALAISRIFTSQLSAAQTALLLDRLALTGLDQRPDVLAKCAVVMREAAEDVDASLLQRLASRRDVGLGAYKGGLVRAILSRPAVSHADPWSDPADFNASSSVTLSGPVVTDTRRLTSALHLLFWPLRYCESPNTATELPLLGLDQLKS